MSGHNKWSSIKHQKGVADAKRGQVFTKLTREIIVSVREEGSNPEANFRLRLAIDKARAANMPTDNIDRAIKRGSGDTGGAALAEMTMEGYGPGGAAILVQALSDNRNRTVQEVRNIFNRGGGNMGEAGCVAWLFDMKGLIMVENDSLDTDQLTLQAIDAGADDVVVEKDHVEIYTKPGDFEPVRAALTKANIPIASAEVAMLPKTTIDLEEKHALQTLKLVNRLEELDDVQFVASNVNFSSDVMEKAQE
ncbi:MAG: YebC/PmpR family DNA-binding transcriptional regulator [Chloroflexota bacterium]